MKGKPWTVEEEKQLQILLQANKSVRVIAKAMGKTRDCIRKKIARLGLEVVVHSESQRTTTTSLVLPSELPSIEEQLKVLSAALKALDQPGLEQAETLRLRSIIQGVKIYKELFADYLDYRGFEAEVLELKQRLAEEKAKSQNVARN
ncbi:MAG: hypothetical protein NWE95_00685 [Candidatus Bathyarchaeota archaeon]|nr:hypothetical protein [Candidatus Bathyarchaeota archaeon]